MANGFYEIGRENILDGDIAVLANNIKLVCVDAADYTRDLNTHNALDDIAAGARVATSGNLASKTATNGVFDAADVTLSAVTGDPFEQVAFYKDSGVESTSFLICNFDTSTGLPLTPNGGDVNIIFNGSGIFKI